MADADVTDRTLVNVQAELFGIARMVSGHSLKHLAAALASFMLWRMLIDNQPRIAS